MPFEARFGHSLHRYLFITITLLACVPHGFAHAQMTTQAPPASGPLETLPDSPSAPRYPPLHLVPATEGTVPLTIESDGPQQFRNGVASLDGNVVIHYQDHVLRADHIDYDTKSGDLTLSGHLDIAGGANHEHIAAAHGIYNLRTGLGQFFEVTGSVEMVPGGKRGTPGVVEQQNLGNADPASPTPSRVIYTSGNPFLFTGRVVAKTGPQQYDLYDGTVTSCQLPKPDWILSSAHFSLSSEKARATNTIFRLRGIPLVYLPYVTNPIDASARQSGILIPEAGYSSSRGFYLGQQVYLNLGRSADLTVGGTYYSARGFAQSASFRFRGPALDFLNVRYSGMFDRGIVLNGVKVNQGGEDLNLAGRFDFSPQTRAAANIEYLSSYTYRQAFTDDFNKAVTSDILSTAYVSRHAHGLEFGALFDRYQGIKLIAQGVNPQQQVRIFHAPTLSAASTEHRLAGTPLEFSFESSASGLKRSQPNFTTSGIVERFDLHPTLALPVAVGGWRIRTAVGARETAYTRSRVDQYVANIAPVESLASLSRSSLEAEAEVRAPVLLRTFKPARFTRFFGQEIRHTVAPEVTYRRAAGIGKTFRQVLRFDDVDVASDTNELEYGLTQRLFRKGGLHDNASSRPACTVSAADTPGFNPASDAECSDDELISWRLTQKYFFDPNFGGGILKGRRNVFSTTLSLSGIAFLTEPRNISPLISRLRVRTSAHTDVEWDFDFDPGARTFTSSNVFADIHQGNSFAALSYARLDAPGRFYIQGDAATQGVTSTVSDFNQLRVLLGYGSPVKAGFSIGANSGLDLKNLTGVTNSTANGGAPNARTVYPALLQYAAVQTTYNWNCCGLSVEYRKFELGSVRNAPGYRFSFTLANIGAVGNLRRAERLF